MRVLLWSNGLKQQEELIKLEVCLCQLQWVNFIRAIGPNPIYSWMLPAVLKAALAELGGTLYKTSLLTTEIFKLITKLKFFHKPTVMNYYVLNLSDNAGVERSGFCHRSY